ncbi:MAG: trypsin-like peptidase domain-containing protein [Deltaproteobacteria bacterium]|nr:trypsin-like peptidase domain-containing protein [Deltaproteobacteria bacterium]
MSSPAAPAGGAAFGQAARAVRPCVVAISAIRPVAGGAAGRAAGPAFVEPFDGVPDRLIAPAAYEAVGSGVVVESSGYVVTNYHVVAGASTVHASLPTRPPTHVAAELVAADPERDLALLRLGTAGPLPAATLGDSSRVRVGDWVLAVGYPFGLELTVTAGIVGATGVSLDIGGRRFARLLQTDAPINKGSSGGPLVDLHGQIVGLNTAIYSPTGVFGGAGFAIPSNRVGAFVVRSLAAHGHALAPSSRPRAAGSAWLGLGLVELRPETAARLFYPYSGGAMVASVVIDSPADEAELARGDILVAIAGERVADVASAERILQILPPGQPFVAVIWRDGKTENVTMRLRGG